MIFPCMEFSQAKLPSFPGEWEPCLTKYVLETCKYEDYGDLSLLYHRFFPT